MITLILGGARSGKSAYAEALAKVCGKAVCYVATSSLSHDTEWQARVAEHRLRRPASWRTVEEPLALADVLQREQGCVLVDCLTLWLSNVLYAKRDTQAETQALCEALAAHKGHVILVSNEVGLGLVPESELGRVFRDAQGRLNQQVAAVADRVEFVAAGLPLVLKGEQP